MLSFLPHLLFQTVAHIEELSMQTNFRGMQQIRCITICYTCLQTTIISTAVIIFMLITTTYLIKKKKKVMVKFFPEVDCSKLNSKGNHLRL